MSKILAQVALFPRAFTWWMFVSVLLNQRRLSIQDGVDSIVAQVKKEGLVLVLANKLNCFLVHAVDEKLIRSHLVVRNVEPTNGLLSEYVGPEVGSITDSFYLTGKVPLKTMVHGFNLMGSRVVFVPGEVPFSNHARGVSIIGQDLGKTGMRCGKRIGRIGA